jgi:hypothetical protein
MTWQLIDEVEGNRTYVLFAEPRRNSAEPG